MTLQSKRLILIAAMPNSPHLSHAGGQVTATRGLLQYCVDKGIAVEPIDTAQSSFPIPSFRRRLMRGLSRTAYLVSMLLRKRASGAVIFAGEGGSLAERCLQAALCRIFQVPAAVCLRSGYILSDAQRDERLRRLYARLLLWPEQIVVQGASWIDEMAKLGLPTSRVSVVANWLPPEFPIVANVNPAPAMHPIRFLFVGWLTERKGLRELMQAFDLAAPMGKATLTIVGGGDLMDEVVAWARQHGDAVTIAGWVDGSDVLKLYDASDVLLLPSYAEGFPNVVIEAMARGLPVIATSIGAIPDTLNDGRNGVVIAPRDGAALAAAMARYIVEPERVRSEGAAALATTVELHGWHNNCARLLALAGIGHADQPIEK